jgi:hypothetical protein
MESRGPLREETLERLGGRHLTVGLPQHPHQHRSEHPVLLAVDEELGEGAALRVAPELSDPVGSLEVGEHEDVEQLGAGSRRESLEASPEPCLYLVECHEGTLVPLSGSSRRSQGLRRTSARIRAVARRSPAAPLRQIAELAQDLAALLGQVRCASADD